MFTIGYAVSISDNDQVKPAGKDYVNVTCFFINLSERHHEEQKRFLISYPSFFIDNLDHVHNWVGCFY